MNKELRIKGKDFFLLGVSILVFFTLRICNLTNFPIFADEAIYIRWAQVMRSEPTLRFLPLSDGKQPLFMWILMVVLRFFQNPLFAGRLVSVISGFGSLLGITVLSYQIFGKKKISLLSGLFYTVVPFFVFFDRMALVDSLLMMLGIFTFIGAIFLTRGLQLASAMITGIFLGLALITKTPGLFFGILAPFVLLLSDKVKIAKRSALQLIKLAGLWLVVFSFAFVIYNLLRLGPNFGMIAIRNKDYVFSVREVLSHPHDPLLPHLRDIFAWFPNLFTLPILLFFLLGIIFGLAQRKLRGRVFFLVLASAGPIFVESVIARVFTPRYLLFASWPLLILTAFGIDQLLAKLKPYLRVIVVLGLVVISLCYDFKLINFPQKAALPRKMRSGYLEEWSSGYGINETVDFINKRLSLTDENILIGTEGYFGTLPDGLQIYFNHHPRVTIIGVGQPVRQVPDSLLNALVDNEVYLVVNQSRMLVDKDPRLNLIDRFPKAEKPAGQDFLLLYQVIKVDNEQG